MYSSDKLWENGTVTYTAYIKFAKDDDPVKNKETIVKHLTCSKIRWRYLECVSSQTETLSSMAKNKLVPGLLLWKDVAGDADQPTSLFVSDPKSLIRSLP